MEAPIEVDSDEEETVVTSIRLQFPLALCAKIEDKILHLDILDKDLHKGRTWLDFFWRHQLDVKFAQLFVNDGSSYWLQDNRSSSKRMVWELTDEVRQFTKSFQYIPHKIGYHGKIVKVEPAVALSPCSPQFSDVETEAEGVGEENQDLVGSVGNLNENNDEGLNNIVSISMEEANNIRDEMARIQGSAHWLELTEQAPGVFRFLRKAFGTNED